MTIIANLKTRWKFWQFVLLRFAILCVTSNLSLTPCSQQSRKSKLVDDIDVFMMCASSVWTYTLRECRLMTHYKIFLREPVSSHPAASGWPVLNINSGLRSGRFDERVARAREVAATTHGDRSTRCQNNRRRSRRSSGLRTTSLRSSSAVHHVTVVTRVEFGQSPVVRHSSDEVVEYVDNPAILAEESVIQKTGTANPLRWTH